MKRSALAWVAITAAAAGLVGCFLDWTAVADPSLFDKADELGAFTSVSLQKWSFALLAVMGGYIAWTVRTSPVNKYIHLMILFGAAMLLILVSARPWQWSDVGLKPGIGFLVCASGGLLYLMAGIGVLASIKRQ